MRTHHPVVLLSSSLLLLSMHAGVACAATAAAPAQDTADTSPLTAALIALDESAYTAWKNKDAKFWDGFLADKFVGWGASGRLDKAAATKEYTGTDCDIKSVALSSGQARLLGKDVALIVYDVHVDGTCSGHKVPADNRAASAYVRDGAHWKGVFHASAAIVDPKTASAPPPETADTKSGGGDASDSAHHDALTDNMIAIERKLGEAWRLHDAQKMAAEMAREMSFIDVFGAYFPNKANALQAWSGSAAACDISVLRYTDAEGNALSPTVGFITFKTAADGTCFGQKLGPIWSSTFYVKEGGAWKWAFGINIPAGGQGG